MIDLRLTGVSGAVAQLRGFVPKLRKRAILEALRAGGRVFRDEARRLTPVLVVPVRRKGAIIRRPGTLRRAISVRTSKTARREGNVGVFVNVRPAKSGARGTFNPQDPYYWRWVEFGTRFFTGRGFLRGAVARSGQALAAVVARLGPAAQKIADRQANE